MKKPGDITLTQAQTEMLFSLTAGATTNFVAGYNYIDQIVEKEGKANGVTAKTEFWYSQAPLINGMPSSAPGYFIRDVTDYGERLDGNSGGNTQQISDDVATQVEGNIISTGIIPGLPTLLSEDISVALKNAGLSLGQWGGSFYYWNETPLGGTQTIGTQIIKNLAGPNDYDKFIAATAGGNYDSLLSSPFTTLSNYISYWTGQGAEVPASVASVIFGRTIDIGLGAPIVGYSNVIGTDISIGNSWYDISSAFSALIFGQSFGDFKVSDKKEISSLNAEQGFRAAHQSILGDSNSDLTPPSLKNNPMLMAATPEITVGTFVNADGSYETTEVDTEKGSGQIFDTDVLAPNGALELSTVEQIGSNVIGASAYYSFGSIGATETLISNGMTSSLQSGSFFAAPQSSWQDASLYFTGPSGAFSQGIYINADNSAESYLITDPTNGYWHETFTNAAGALTETLAYAPAYDPKTGQYVLGTTETIYPSGKTQFWKAGDPNAPPAYFPSGAPNSLASSQGFWANLIAGDVGTGAARPEGSPFQLTAGDWLSSPDDKKILDQSSLPREFGHLNSDILGLSFEQLRPDFVPDRIWHDLFPRSA